MDLEQQLLLIEEPIQLQRAMEISLYAPVAASLANGWVPREDLREFILEITANQGRRQTGGFWSRPDITILGISAHPYLPGRNLEVATFEIKKSYEEGIYGLFESAAHSAFANRSYLLLQADPKIDIENTEIFQRTESECQRFGIGLITFTDPVDWSSFETVVEAEFKSPNPANVNRFIATQISEENRHRLLTMFR